jgi:hypothetical protein
MPSGSLLKARNALHVFFSTVKVPQVELHYLVVALKSAMKLSSNHHVSATSCGSSSGLSKLNLTIASATFNLRVKRS